MAEFVYGGTGGARVAAGRRLKVLDLGFVEEFDFVAVVGHLGLILVTEVLERLVELGFVLFGEAAVDFAYVDLAASSGFG